MIYKNGFRQANSQAPVRHEQSMLYRKVPELIAWPKVHRAPMEEAVGKGKAEGSGRDDLC